MKSREQTDKAAGRRGKLFSVILSAAILTTLARTPCPASLTMVADITTNTKTEFATYKPQLVSVAPAATPYTIAADFSNVVNFSQFTFTDAQKTKLLKMGL